jgi:hypothetical protein
MPFENVSKNSLKDKPEIVNSKGVNPEIVRSKKYRNSFHAFEFEARYKGFKGKMIPEKLCW